MIDVLAGASIALIGVLVGLAAAGYGDRSDSDR